MWIPSIEKRDRDYNNKDEGDVMKGGDGRRQKAGMEKEGRWKKDSNKKEGSRDGEEKKQLEMRREEIRKKF